MAIQYFDDGSTYDDGEDEGFDGSPGVPGATPSTDEGSDYDINTDPNSSPNDKQMNDGTKTTPGEAPSPGALASLNKFFRENGITSKDLTWADILKIGGGALAGGAAFQQGMKPRVETDFNALRSQVGAGGLATTSAAQGGFDKLFNKPMQSGAGMARSTSVAPTVATQRYANGGLAVTDRFVTGPGGGQDDKIDARLSPGEYVFDADVVAALGDGNNEEGARRLDQLRENIRSHKRSSPSHSIPPKAKPVEKYLKGSK